jgi:hypothetical protein
MNDPRTAPKAGWIQRHARWIVPLVLVPVVHTGFMAGVKELWYKPEGIGVPLFLLMLLFLLGAFAGPVVLVILAIVGACQAYRDHVRSTGQFSAADSSRSDAGTRRSPTDRGP